MTQQHDSQHDQAAVVDSGKPQVSKPPLFKVILLDDEYTPMDFVVIILQQFFQMPEEKATQVMLHVHYRGQGVCGVYTRDIAETKVEQVNEYARAHEHPLMCVMDKV